MWVYLLWDHFMDGRRELYGATEHESIAIAFENWKVDGLWRRSYTKVCVGQGDAVINGGNHVRIIPR